MVGSNTLAALTLALSLWPAAVSVEHPPVESQWDVPQWDDLSFLITCDDSTFRRAVGPLANATFLSYVSTRGSYYNPRYDNATVPGWARSFELYQDPVNGGMRALLFLKTDTATGNPSQAIVAFRGTDLGDSEPSHLADSCADQMLWERIPYSELPDNCRNAFNESTLDYASSALTFVEEVQAKYDGIRVMLTGHSLGAGLATVVAARFNQAASSVEEKGIVRALSFAAPPVAQVLGPAVSLDHSKFAVLADPYDPVFVESVCPQQQTSGAMLCVFSSGEEPSSCRRCYEKFPVNSSKPECGECFSERHIYKHYYDDLVPGPRAECTKTSKDVPSPWSARCFGGEHGDVNHA